MDEAIKEREKATREKKHTDDLINKHIISNKLISKHKTKVLEIENELRNEEPFYERLRREDKARNDKKRKEAIRKRAR